MRRTTLLIFILAISARTAISTLQILQGIHSIPWLPTLTTWSDFYGYYVNQLGKIVNGMVPYRDFDYSYTPLFIYSLYPFYLIGGPYSASIPIVVGDSLTAPVIYLTLRRLAPEKVAVLGGLSYSLLPFALLYEGYLWLSSQPMTLFIALSVYFARDRQLSSSLSLAFATMVKQEALFLLPAYLIWYMFNARGRIWKTLGCLVGIFSIVSLPFLILSAPTYLTAISYGASGAVLQGLGIGDSTPMNPRSPIFSDSGCETVTLTLLGTHTGCSYFFISYPNPFYTNVLNFLDGLAQWTVIPLLVLVGIALLESRRRTYFLEIGGAYSMTLFLLVFGHFINFIHRYYLIPVYVLLLASSRNQKAVLATFTISTVALLTTAGAFQVFLVALAELLLLTQDEMGRSKFSI